MRQKFSAPALEETLCLRSGTEYQVDNAADGYVKIGQGGLGEYDFKCQQKNRYPRLVLAVVFKPA